MSEETSNDKRVAGTARGPAPAWTTPSPARCSSGPCAAAGCSASLISFCCLMLLLVSDRLAVHPRRRHLGHQDPGRLGLRHHQLRLVDRDRPRRHLHLRDPAAAPPGLAHLDQPLHRGDDALRRGLRGDVSRSSTSAGRNMPTGCLPIRIRWASGRSGAARWSGMSSRSPPMASSRWSSGTSASCRTSACCATARSSTGKPSARGCSASSRSAGAARAKHWEHYHRVYLILGGLAAPLVISVHSIVGMDFADRHRARLALDDFPAVLRRRRDLLRLRDGAHAADPGARGLPPPAITSPWRISTRRPR